MTPILVAVAVTLSLAAFALGRTTAPRAPSKTPDRPSLDPVDVAGWGALAGLRESVGPGTRFFDFANRLKATGLWSPDHYWVLVPGGTPRAYFNLTGRKVVIEMVVETEPFYQQSGLDATFLFAPKMGMLAVAAGPAERNEQILTAARAMALSETELERLKRVLDLLPVVWNSSPAAMAEQQAEAVMVFCRETSPRLIPPFSRGLQAMAAERRRMESKGFSQETSQRMEDPPALGFPLSERSVADVVFCGALPGIIFDDVNYLEPGPWWSLVIYDRRSDYYTSRGNPVIQHFDSGELERIKWPRLTLKEVDGL